MSIQEKSKENSSKVTKEIEDENLELEIEGSQNSLVKKPGSKEAVKALVRSSNKSKVNQPKLGARMSTRSASAADKNATKSINKNMVIVKGQSQESTKKEEIMSGKISTWNCQRKWTTHPEITKTAADNRVLNQVFAQYRGSEAHASRETDFATSKKRTVQQQHSE